MGQHERRPLRRKPARDFEPGTHWAYSTGTTQILARIIGRSVGGGREGLRDFAEREVAQPPGLASHVLEFDAAGTMLGGGYVCANARDWARLGLLYLRDGTWEGRRILPEGWVDFTRSVAPAENNRTYGAHFWISARRSGGSSRSSWPERSLAG